MSSAQTPPEKPSQQQIAALTGSFRAGRHTEALELARALATQFPGSLAAWNIRGAAARALGSLDEAETSFRQLEMLDPAFAGAPYNLGLTLQDLGRSEDAAAAYRRALAIDPQLAQAHNNLGNLLTRSGELDAAISHLEAARRLRPDLPEIHNSLGNALKRAERFDAALAAYRVALKVAPGFAKARYNLGVLEQERGDPEVAVSAFEEVLRQEPENALARLHLIYQLAHHCDWDALDAHREAIPALGVTTPGVPPWPLLALEDAPQHQLARGRSWSERRFDAPAALPARPVSRHQRIRIGYFSGDFHDHPSMHLMAGLLASHDRSRFDVHAFSYGEQREDDYRRKARQCVDHFHDVARQPDQAIVDLARRVGLDIAIDRKGYSAGTRNNLLQHRLAPVQVNYLAYPGTLGAPFIDYIVGDATVIPDEQRSAISESVIFLPHSYQATDNQRAIAETATSRRDFGLPEEALVLCCFNATYKITPVEFDIWMRLLSRIDLSVLWLYRSNPLAERNLRKQAERRGIDPARLVFAARLPNPEHLARHRHADLAIDTFAVNAHTTCNDALWTGLPMVTMAGQQFAARVAASLLRAVGLPDMVTHTPEQYERLILELASDRTALQAVRERLAENRVTRPLFDTRAYTGHFEAGLSAAHERHRAGLPPADIVVPA